MSNHVIAPAKVNLTLHVTGERSDGYHLLDSYVMFADLGDTLTFAPGNDISLHVTGPYAAGVPGDARNLVWRAAQAVGWTGRIDLVKNLPHGAGIGGGSADAAAVLRAVGDGRADALALGADVPVCVLSKASRMRGIGDHVSPVRHAFPFFAVLVNPGIHVATPEVFKSLTRKDNPAMSDMPDAQASGTDWITWLAQQRNDLEAPACACAPEIATVLRAVRGTENVLMARMSGSGATCFGLYSSRSDAQRASDAVQAAHPDWWCVHTVLS